MLDRNAVLCWLSECRVWSYKGTAEQQDGLCFYNHFVFSSLGNNVIAAKQ